MPIAFSSEHPSGPLFRPFSWHRPEVPPSHQKILAEHAHDVGNGIASLLSLIEFHEAQELDGVPLLTAVDKGSLLRLAIVSSKLLSHFAYVQIAKSNRAQSKTSGQKVSENDLS